MLFEVEDQVHCRLLLEDACPVFSGDAVAEHLNRVLPDLAFCVLDESNGVYMVLSDTPAEIYVLISIVQEKVDGEILERSLSSPYARAVTQGIEEVVKRHRSHVHITVSNNHPVDHVIAGISDEAMGDLRRLLDPLETEFEARQIEGKILVCHHVAWMLTELLNVTAIHWGQSDLIFGPGWFAAPTAGGYPSLLHVHPFFYRSDPTSDGRDTVAFTTCGARHVIGREIDFKPCPADFPWMFERTLGFLQMARMNDYEAVPDGDSFGADENEIIRVRHLPPVQGELPLITLEVEKSIEHGIEPDPRPSALSSIARAFFGRRKPN